MYFTFTSPFYTANSTGKVCPLCGAAESDIIRTGKVGCAKCYEVFSDIINPYINRIFGDAQHVGRIPGGNNPTAIRLRELSKLKNELKTAVSEENYEYAAVLRDQISELESD